MKWNAAIYLTPDGNWQTVYPEDLHDLEFRAFLRGQELWDSEREKRLFIRYRVDTPHFYSLSNRTRRIIERLETSTLHHQRVEQVLTALQQQEFKFGYVDHKAEEGPEFITLFNSEQYTWSEEVVRSRADIGWRHDIFGAQASHRLSDRCPWVAIEVIDSHFPEDRAFDAWLQLSLEFPCLVLFDFVKKWNYYFQVKDNCQVRVIYYIYEGAVWKSREQLPNCNAAIFKERLTTELSKR